MKRSGITGASIYATYLSPAALILGYNLTVNLIMLSTQAFAADFFEGFGFYLGDPHVHTGHSTDGGSSDIGEGCPDCGAFSEVMEIARGNGLDFVTLSEHVNDEAHTTAEGFAAVIEATVTGNDPEGGFLTVMGAELWFRIGGAMVGHKNLYIFADNGALKSMTLNDVQFNSSEAGIEDCDDIWEWAAEVEEDWGSAILVPHHPAASGQMTTDWYCHDSKAAQVYSPVTEIYSRHGSSDWQESSFDPLWMGYSDRGSLGFAMDPEGMALRMGFFGGTDSHDTNPGGVCEGEIKMTQHPFGGGLTIAMLPESDSFNRENLLHAVRDRQTYATSGPLLPAVVRYESGGAILGGMGAFVGLPDAQPLDVTLSVPPELAVYVLEVSLLGPHSRVAMTDIGDGHFTLTLDAEDVPAWTYPEITVSGADWYGTGGCEDGGKNDEERVWLSPTWFDPADADLDGDGVSWSEGDCDDGSATVYPGAIEDCTSGLDEDCDGSIDTEDDDCAPLDTGGFEDRTGPAQDTDDPPGVTPIGTPEWSEGSCATVRGAPGLASWGLLVLLAWRRRVHAGVDVGGPDGLCRRDKPRRRR
ncbi:MAG: hypothetical protein ACI8RZ_000748 [Myxococcota bacterium]|jgi:hypothetical protein